MTFRGASAALLAVAVLLSAACDRDDPKQPPPAPPPAPAACAEAADPPASGTSEGRVTFGGLERTYQLHVPPGHDPSEPVPLVFNFHGHGSSAVAQMVYADFRPLADRHGFVVVAPDGQGSPRHFTLLGASATEADDVEFAGTVLDHLATRLCIDDRRVFATGMSNGGALSSVLACRAADRFAAVAAVAAVIYVSPCDGEPLERPAPIVAMMGTADPVVPYAGGRVNCCGNPTIPATEDTLRSFARRSGCGDVPDDRRVGSAVLHRSWTGCDDGAAVELYTIEGGGHTWPGASFDLESRGLGKTTKELVATETIWAFFTAHARART